MERPFRQKRYISISSEATLVAWHSVEALVDMS